MPLPKLATPTFETRIPSTNQLIEFRPFVVKEEKALLIASQSKNTKQMSSAVKNILQSCIMTEGVDVNNLATFDIEYIFLQLRAKSVADVARPSISCPKCDESIELEINLDEINVEFDPNHTNDIRLSENPVVGIRFKYPTLESQTITGDESNMSAENMIDMICNMIDMIYDEETTYTRKDFTQEELVQFVEGLSQAQFKEVSKFFTTLPALKHDLHINCEKCGHSENHELKGLADFF